MMDSGHFDTLYIALGLYPIRPGIFWTFLDPRGGGGDLPLSFFVFFPLFSELNNKM